MLMEVITAEADHGNVHTLYPFGAQRASHGSRGAGDRLRLAIRFPNCESGGVPSGAVVTVAPVLSVCDSISESPG
jgi:hypothetical protein